MRWLPDGVVKLIFADPPYNIGVFAKMPAADYLAWCESWIAEASRVLAPNGALWVSHSEPRVLTDISRIIERYGRGMVNFIIWDKWNGERFKVDNGIKAGPLYGAMWKQVCKEANRSFGQAAEYLIYHADEGEWTAQCDRERGFIFEPLRAYLAGEWERAGLDKVDANVACGFSPTPGGMASRHYFSRSQWQLPTEEHYHSLRTYANNHNHGGEYLRRDYEYLRRDYEDLRRDYEGLRRDYEGLRYTFNNPGKVSSVWQIPPAPRTWHPTPKPEALLERIVLATSNEGDLVLDPFLGSGTTMRVAHRLGRRCISGDICAEYVDKATADLAQPQQLQLEVTA